MTSERPSTDTARAIHEKLAAFEREALPLLGNLYRLALRLSRDVTLAEDLVQETMLKAYRSWHRFTPGSNARAWLRTILRNTYFSECRRSWRINETFAADGAPLAITDDREDVDPEGDGSTTIVDDEIIRAVDSLPVKFRDAVMLRDVEGLTYEEIADINNVPIGTVKSRLSRARRKLRSKLCDHALALGYVVASQS